MKPTKRDEKTGKQSQPYPKHEEKNLHGSKKDIDAQRHPEEQTIQKEEYMKKNKKGDRHNC